MASDRVWSFLVYLTGRVSPDRYRFIRPESGLELSQRRAVSAVEWGVRNSEIQERELINRRWVMFVTLSALSSNGSRALLGKTPERYGFSSSRCRKKSFNFAFFVECLRFLMKYQNFVDGSYLGQALPFSSSTLIRIEVLVIGYIEFQHNLELDSEKRLYLSMEFRIIAQRKKRT